MDLDLCDLVSGFDVVLPGPSASSGPESQHERVRKVQDLSVAKMQ